MTGSSILNGRTKLVTIVAPGSILLPMCPHQLSLLDCSRLFASIAYLLTTIRLPRGNFMAPTGRPCRSICCKIPYLSQLCAPSKRRCPVVSLSTGVIPCLIQRLNQSRRLSATYGFLLLAKGSLVPHLNSFWHTISKSPINSGTVTVPHWLLKHLQVSNKSRKIVLGGLQNSGHSARARAQARTTVEQAWHT